MEYLNGWDAYMSSQPFNSHLHSSEWQKGYMDAQDFDQRAKIWHEVHGNKTFQTK